MTEDRVKPVSSNLARARTSAIPTTDAAAEARHEAFVCHAYVTIGQNKAAHISALPFPASLNKANGTQQLTRSVKAAMSDILMSSDERCTEDLRSAWVPG